MQIVGVLGLMLAVVVGYLAFSRVSTLETALEGVWTTGAMNLLVNHTSFFFFLVVAVGGAALLVAAAAWAVNNLT